MNKKGFTLVELMVSISIITIVLVFMLTTLIKLRNQEVANGNDTYLLVNQAFVTQALNEDILNNGGINSVSCSSSSCNIIMNNAETRALTITNLGKTLSYTSPSETLFLRTLKDSSENTYNELTSTARVFENHTLFKIIVHLSKNTEFNSEAYYYDIEEIAQTINTYVVTATSNNEEYASVNLSSAEVLEGYNYYFKYIPVLGYGYVSVTGCDNGTYNISTNILTVSNVTSDVTCVVNFSGESTLTSYNFVYTGNVQTISLVPGTYTLEVWGAQGGDSYGNSAGNLVGTTTGANGGYSKGTIIISSRIDLFVLVGGKGGNYTSASAGYNGGGLGYTSNGYNGSGGGGGASDIRIAQDSLFARLIVAGGGGGAANGYSDTSCSGGEGGGLTGIKISYGSFYSGAGGTQISGGAAGKSRSNGGNPGVFGIGGQYSTTGGTKGGAGGGGWYGGGSGGSGNWEGATGGGGGSGWVYTAESFNTWQTGNPTDAANYLLDSTYYLINTETLAGNETFVSPNGSMENGHSGNGHVRITRIS